MTLLIRLLGACYLLLLLLLPVCVSPFALAQRNATKPKRGQVRQREQRIASPTNIIVVTNTNDSGPGSLRDALATANDGDTIDATGIRHYFAYQRRTSNRAQRDHQRQWCWESGGQR